MINESTVTNYQSYLDRFADSHTFSAEQPMPISEFLKWAERWEREYNKAWGDYVTIDFETINELENALCV